MNQYIKGYVSTEECTVTLRIESQPNYLHLDLVNAFVKRKYPDFEVKDVSLLELDIDVNEWEQHGTLIGTLYLLGEDGSNQECQVQCLNTDSARKLKTLLQTMLTDLNYKIYDQVFKTETTETKTGRRRKSISTNKSDRSLI